MTVSNIDDDLVFLNKSYQLIAITHYHEGHYFASVRGHSLAADWTRVDGFAEDLSITHQKYSKEGNVWIIRDSHG